jgi:hypothetical protein
MTAIVCLVVIIITLYGTGKRSASAPSDIGPAISSTTDQSPDSTHGYPDAEKSDPAFSFTAGAVTLTLRENNLEEKLKSLTMTALRDETKILGEGADTFTGSALRTVDYGGFTLVLMAPRDALDNFWILQMTATDDTVRTAGGIAVGDTLQALLEKYPEAEAVKWDPGLYKYTPPGDDTPDEIVFNLAEDRVTQITMTYILP